jgi:hypothetical protein
LKALKLSNARGTPDALLIERFPALMAASLPQSEDDLKRAFGTGDAYLMAATLEINADHFAARLGGEFADGKNRGVLFAAAAAAGCEFIGNCQDHVQAIMYCAANKACASLDLRDYLRVEIDAPQRALFDKTSGVFLRHLMAKTIPK